MSDVALLGVDGCRGGWVAARVEAPGAPVTWRWTTAFRELYDDATATTIAVDIPIGLPDDGTRACDSAARRMLGRRGVTVFAAPVRAVLHCADYAEARRLLATRGGRSMSAQAFGIVAAVRDVDECVQPDDDERVVEAHPEVAFALMAAVFGDATVAEVVPVPVPGKRTAAGVARRLELLEHWRPDVLTQLAGVPASVPVDDALDALACLWVAHRWAAGDQAAGDRACLGDGSRDSRDLPMRIASPAAARRDTESG